MSGRRRHLLLSVPFGSRERAGARPTRDDDRDDAGRRARDSDDKGDGVSGEASDSEGNGRDAGKRSG
jgi:hypothetical protein